MGITKLFIATLFPNRCTACGEIIEDGEIFCDYCFSMLESCNKQKLCIKCGLPKKECTCKYNVFSFSGCVAPYYYLNSVRRAMHIFKFRGRSDIALFFAQQMALSIKQNLSEKHFDFITCVPLKKYKRLRRGYNQSELLARHLSEILDIPFYNNVLRCNKKRKIQHKLTYKERIKNMENAYKATVSLCGESILLIDDIKTTGATLSECSKQLLGAGAGNVHCVVAVITRKKKGKEDGNRNRN